MSVKHRNVGQFGVALNMGKKGKECRSFKNINLGPSGVIIGQIGIDMHIS